MESLIQISTKYATELLVLAFVLITFLYFVYKVPLVG